MSERKASGGAPRASTERRRYIRIVEGRPITFVSARGQSGEGELIDISLRGMRFVSDASLGTGEKVRTVFILGNGIALDLSGVIRHRQGRPKKSVYGLEFSIQDHHDLREHLKLNHYIIHARAQQDRLLQKELLGKK